MSHRLREGLLVCSLALRLALTVLCIAPAIAQAQSIGMVEEKTYDFDIGAGDLSTELVQFTEFTGQQLFYDSLLARGRTGQAVQGEHTLMEGLMILLQGTGLSAHINGGDITLSQGARIADRHKPDISSSNKVVNLDVLSVESQGINIESPDYRSYAGYVASQVKNAVLMDNHLQDAQFDILVKIWLDPDGRIARFQLPPQSVDDNVNKEIALTLDQLTINPPPPANMPAFRIRIHSAEK